MFTFDKIVTSYFLSIDLSICFVPFGKETQEVVCVGQLVCSAYLACNPLALSCVEISYFVIG